MIGIDVWGGTEFWIYIHDVGEEYFLHYDYWPTVPPTHQVQPDSEHIELMVHKKVSISDENCIEGEYSYFGKC